MSTGKNPQRILCMLCVVLLARTVSALDIRTEITLTPLGDAKVHMDVKARPEEYVSLRKRLPTPEMFVKRVLAPDREDGETKVIKAQYDDEFMKILVEAEVLGQAVNCDRYWRMEIGKPDMRIRAIDVGDTQTTFETVEAADEGMRRGEIVIKLPAGATDAKYIADSREFRYSLPVEEYTGEFVSVEPRIRWKRQIMTAVYKQYGSEEFPELWVAKAIFKNTGEVPLRDFRVRFSLGDYSDGFGEDLITPLCLPGQHVVNTYRPILTERCAGLESASPVKLRIQYSYEQPDGQRKQQELVRRLTMLGGRHFIFTSLPEEEITRWADNYANVDFLAAWVTAEDPVVKEFGSMANQMVRGAAAHHSDKDAITIAGGIYELMRANRITYQSPTGLSFSSGSQHLKFPRDVLRDHSGTCIDLAIAFAAFAGAQGLDPGLILIPGHCFSGIFLPKSHNFAPVEMTFLGGGTPGSSKDFDAAYEMGMTELKKADKDGRLIIVRVANMRQQGLHPPELESLPADILGKWGIQRPSAPAAARPEPQTQARRPAPAPTPERGSPPPSPQPQAGGSSTYRHPDGLFTMRVPEGFKGTRDKLGVVFVSDALDLEIRMNTAASVVNGKTVDEETMVGAYLLSLPFQPAEASQVDPPKLGKIGQYPTLSRTLRLHDANGFRCDTATLYFEARKHRYLLAFRQGTRGMQEGKKAQLEQTIVSVVSDLRFTTSIGKPRGH
ncbi:MAG: hypothetical protein JXR37_25175 [Kiritimatiellae bacterium]|nr:hypothetical protein [Kiritimatiellia bacterium]